VIAAFDPLPSDLASAHAMLLAERAARLAAEAQLIDARAEAANAQADLSGTEVRVPTKPAMHSNSKPAGDSDLKPATLASFAWVFDDDVVWGLEGQAA